MPRFRVKVWMLMLLVGACAISAAGMVNRARARAQRAAVLAVERSPRGMPGAVAGVTYDYEYAQGRDGAGKPPGPAWLRRLLGDDYFREVTGVTMWNIAPASGRLRPLRAFPRLEYLQLQLYPITGEEIADISAMTGLRELQLAGNGVDDIGLSHLGDLGELRHLDLSCNFWITDAGLVHLGRLGKIETLALACVPLTDAGLARLAGLTEMRDLDLSATNISDAGLAHLGRMRHLRTLTLARSRITDEGLAHLSELTELTELNLNSTGVEGAGLEHLRGLPRLRRLSIRDTGVVDDDIDALRTSLPALKARRWSGWR